MLLLLNCSPVHLASLIQLLLLSTCWGSVTQCSVKSIDAFLMYCSCLHCSLHCCCCCCCCCYLLSSAVVATQWTVAAAVAAPNQLQGQPTFKIKHKKLFALLIPLKHQYISYHPMPRIKHRGNWQIRDTSHQTHQLKMRKSASEICTVLHFCKSTQASNLLIQSYKFGHAIIKIWQNRQKWAGNLMHELLIKCNETKDAQ